VIHAVRAHVAKTENNDAGQPGTTGRNQLTKTQVVRQQNAILISRLCEHIWILELVKPCIVQVRRVVPEAPQIPHRHR
jgi:hypothetical protein